MGRFIVQGNFVNLKEKCMEFSICTSIITSFASKFKVYLYLVKKKSQRVIFLDLGDDFDPDEDFGGCLVLLTDGIVDMLFLIYLTLFSKLLRHRQNIPSQ